MIKSVVRTLSVFSLILFLADIDGRTWRAEGARKIRIKLTTLAPKNSSYHKALLLMGQEWKDASDGQINLVIYAGGIQGGESAMVERMTINQTQASLLTGVGLADIERDVTGLQFMPMVFRSVEEFDYVSGKLYPKLEKSLKKKGYIVLFWADAGFIRFFTKRPVVTLDDMRSLKLFTVAGDAMQESLMVSTGLNPVPLDLTDIMMSLQTGLVDAVPMPPLYALAIQAYGPAPHMTELYWVPIMGAAVVLEKTWMQIPGGLRPVLLAAAKRAGESVIQNGRRENEEAIQVMVDQWGLKVHNVPPDAMAGWEREMSGFYPKIRDGMVPEAMFDEVMRLVDEYRASN
jgi:TRAP-type C4-dicarboxylate transport system substrate-binding protein